jgi:hypothetical protein
MDYFMPVSAELAAFYKTRVRPGVSCVYIPHHLEVIPETVSPLTGKGIISVGRFSPEKGMDELIRVYQGIAKDHPDWALHLVGDGEQRAILEQQAAETGLGDQIHFHGFCTQEQIRNLMKEMSVYVMTSHKEAFGLVLIEAQAMGLPCVAYDSAQGAREILRSGENGVLIPSRDRGKMTEQICRWIEDAAERRSIGDRGRASVLIYKKENELRNLGGESLIESDDIVINTYLLASVFKFSSEYKTLIEGSIVNPNLNKSYIGAANINTLLTQHFKNEVTSIDPFDKLTNEEILIVINNTKGLKPSLFIPEDAFEVLVKQQIQRLEEPSLRYVKKIYNELINSLDLIDVKEIKRYKLLESKIKEIMIATINQCLAPTNQMVKNIIQIELSFINSSHPDFLSDGTMKEEMQRHNEVDDVEVKLNCNDLQFSEREIMEINIIRNLIVSYFNVVKKNICDVIPKTIVCFLVNKTKEISEYSMVEKLYKSNEDIKKLLMEDNAVIEKRKEIKDNLSFLKNALLVLEKESNN